MLSAKLLRVSSAQAGYVDDRDFRSRVCPKLAFGSVREIVSLGSLVSIRHHWHDTSLTSHDKQIEPRSQRSSAAFSFRITASIF